MKSYEKIQHYNHGPFGEHCYAFYKYDGSNFRAEWGRKRGWYKWGTRNVMIDKNTELYGEAIDIFLNKYAEPLDEIFRDKYPRVNSFVVFAEFFGPNSFAGKHEDGDKKDLVLFDINQFRRGIIPPKEFIDNFGHLDIPKVIYEGEYNQFLIDSVVENKWSLKEGVVCKGAYFTKSYGEQVWMNKIKCKEWVRMVKTLYGEKALIEEFNSDGKILKEYEH